MKMKLKRCVKYLIPILVTEEMLNITSNHYLLLQVGKGQALGSFFFFLNKFIYFLPPLGLRCCMWAFSSCGEQGPLFVVVHGLLIVVASLVAEHRL